MEHESVLLNLESIHTYVFSLASFVIILVAAITIAFSIEHGENNVPKIPPGVPCTLIGSGYILLLLNWIRLCGKSPSVAYAKIAELSICGGWCWVTWIIYGLMWQTEFVYEGWVYWVFSCVHCISGVFNFITGKWGRRLVRNTLCDMCLTTVCCVLLFFPHLSSVFTWMNPWEMLVRTVLFYLTYSAQTFVMICTNQQMNTVQIIRECIWVLVTNKWCILCLGFQWMTLVIEFSSCFSFKTYSSNVDFQEAEIESGVKEFTKERMPDGKDTHKKENDHKQEQLLQQQTVVKTAIVDSDRKKDVTPSISVKPRRFIPYTHFRVAGVAGTTAPQPTTTHSMSEVHRLMEKSRHVRPFETK